MLHVHSIKPYNKNIEKKLFFPPFIDKCLLVEMGVVER